MTFYVPNQNMVVLALAVFGAVTGFLCDAVSVKRRFIPTGRILTFIEDLFGCVFLTLIYQITVFVTNYGYVRWYEIASAGVGFFLYRTLFSALCVRIMCFVGNIIKTVLKIVLSPFVLLLHMVGGIFEKTASAIGRKRLVFASVCLEKRCLEAAKNGFYYSNSK